MQTKLMNNATRRRWLGAAAGTVAATAAGIASRKASAIDYTEPVEEANGLTAYLNHGNLFVRWDNLPLVNYRAQNDLKYPYFHPLNGPLSGLALTSESALPYPHHRGIWMGCQPLNGGDYWTPNPLQDGQIKSSGVVIPEHTERNNFSTFSDKCEWIWPGHQSPFKDERTFSIEIFPEKKQWVLDMDFRLEALEDIEIKKAKHSFVAIRAAADISPPYGGILMNSEGGIGAEGTYGREARWCGYHGKRRQNPAVVEGITMMTHPENPWRPIWFTRDYGHLSPSPFNFLEKPWQLEKGESIRLRYRFLLHAGTPKDAKVDASYESWIKGAI